MRAAFETVGEEEVRSQFSALSSQMIEHELIAIRSLEHLALQVDHSPRPQEPAEDRLRVRAAGKPGGFEVQ